MRVAFQLFALVVALGAAAPAFSELYKWVDERGVTNYSNEPPAAAATTKKLARVDSSKLSVYTPDESLMQAVKATRERALRAMSEPEPASTRSPVTQISATQTGYEQCLSSGRLGCEDLYGNNYSWYVPAVFPGRRLSSTRVTYPHAPTGHAGTRSNRGSLLR